MTEQFRQPEKSLSEKIKSVNSDLEFRQIVSLQGILNSIGTHFRDIVTDAKELRKALEADGLEEISLTAHWVYAEDILDELNNPDEIFKKYPEQLKKIKESKNKNKYQELHAKYFGWDDNFTTDDENRIRESGFNQEEEALMEMQDYFDTAFKAVVELSSLQDSK